MKALKKICTALMILAFAFVFASCSNGSDSDDDDVSSTNVLLPSSVGENVLAGKSYKYAKSSQKTTTYAFKDSTVTKTKVETDEESSETEIEEYKYTYNANTGLLSLNLVSLTIDDKKMTSMNDIYRYFTEDLKIDDEKVKEEFGDDDMFKEITSMCYFVKANGNILLGNYFANEKDVKYSKFVCEKNSERIKAVFDDGIIEVDAGDTWKIELNATEKTFSGAEIAGSYTVEKATKTLKDLNGVDGLNQANGYITIKFSTLPSTLETPPYSMTTDTGYKFIFDLDCDEYTKQ